MLPSFYIEKAFLYMPFFHDRRLPGHRRKEKGRRKGRYSMVAKLKRSHVAASGGDMRSVLSVEMTMKS